MHVTKNQQPAVSAIPGIRHATLAGSAQGLKALSVWDQVIAPGAATPPHRHDCEEVVLCSAGVGRLVIDGQPDEWFGAGTTVCIPRNAVHQILNHGEGPLRLVALFSTTPVVPILPDGTAIDLPWST
jgi:quercetin dioxygenase-like cupin family protein